MEGCTKSLWTVADDGTNLTRITPPAHLAPPNEASFDDEPSWSPDGRFLLYRRDVHARSGRHSLWITSLDGSFKVQVGPEAPNQMFDTYNGPEWSPDGKWIVFHGVSAAATRTGEAPRSAIWLLSIDGTVVRQLTEGSDVDSEPTFSPDGRRIAFVRSTGISGRESAVLTMNLDGTEIAPVIIGTPPASPGSITPGALRISWSPDGSEFALAYDRELYTLRSGAANLQWRGRTGPPVSIGGPFSQLEWSTEPLPALIYSLPMEARSLQRLELTGPPTEARPLTGPVTNPGNPANTVGDEDPAWRPSAPLPPPLELIPPVTLPIDLSSVGGRAARISTRALSVRKRHLGFLALDSSGVTQVEVAMGRRLRVRRPPRCRFWRRTRPPARRSCRRPAWQRVRGPAGFARLVRRLPPGRYQLRMRARDALDNRTDRPRPIRLRLRR